MSEQAKWERVFIGNGVRVHWGTVERSLNPRTWELSGIAVTTLCGHGPASGIGHLTEEVDCGRCLRIADPDQP